MSELNGARVALLEARMSGELANLVRRRGGEPRCAAAVREVPLPCDAEVRAFVGALRDGSIEVVVFLTGVGAAALFDTAERLGLWDELASLLAARTLVCRGPKPIAALKKRQLTPTLVAASPFTAKELAAAMDATPLAGVGVGLVHYGERSEGIADALVVRGARLHELCLYAWELPEDTAPLRDMVRALTSGEVDAIAFTSQVQVKHLLLVAREAGEEEALRSALGTRVIVASVGPTCTAALEAAGIHPHAEPESPKMGPMLDALARFLETRATAP